MRDLHHIFSGCRYAHSIQAEHPLPFLVRGHISPMMRQLRGVDMQLQRNKVHNLRMAVEKINGLLIHPGETFSFWKLIGSVGKKQGYLPALTISGCQLGSDYGGGLCQLANMIHWLVLHSPLQVTELHHHSDSLFPDERRSVPFGTGTSVFYKNIDYQFKNPTDQPMQLLLSVTDTNLCGELRSARPLEMKYRIIEENHHFRREADGSYYRISQIYRLSYEADSLDLIKKELILDNHSRVMYDSSLIPPDQIREEDAVCS